MNRHLPGPARTLACVSVAAALLASLLPDFAFGQAATYEWKGTVSSDFTNPANWTPNVVAPVGGATPINARLSVHNGASNPLIYTADQGYTIYASSGRSLFIGSNTSGAMTITGGTFESQAATEDGMANSGYTASLTLDGGNYLNNAGAKTFVVVYDGPASNGTLTINNGNFTAFYLKYGYTAAATGTGTVNLNGGTLSTARVSDVSTSTLTSRFNFNGGLLKAMATNDTFLQGLDEVRVQAGGAKIDTNGYNITIAQNLLNDTGSIGGGLTKSGAGALILSGANTYTGATQVDAGLLRIANAMALGTADGGTTVANGTRLELTNNITVAGESITINGFGDGTGALQSESGDNTWGGTVTFSAGDTRIGAENGSTLRISGNILAGENADAVRVRNKGGTTVFSGAQKTYAVKTQVMSDKLQIDGDANILPVATTLVLGTRLNNTLSATFDLNGYNQELAGLGTEGDAGLQTVTNSSATRGATLTINTGAASTYAGLLTGDLALVKSGTSSLTLAGANTYSGETQINAGALRISNASALGTAAGGTTVANGAWLELTGGITVDGERISLAGTGDSYGTLQSQSGDNTWGGTVSLNADCRLGAEESGSVLRVSGDIQNGNVNSIRVRNSLGKTVFSGTPKTYTGNTQVMSGLLQIDGGANILPTSTTLVLGTNLNDTLSGTFDLNGFDQRIAGLGTEGDPASQTVTNSSPTLATLTVQTAGASTYAGALTGNLALVKSGSDTLALSGTNTLTGDVQVLDGTLALTHASHNNLGSVPVLRLDAATAVLDVTGLAAGRLDVADGQRLQGLGTVRGDLAVGAGASLAPGNSAGHLALDGDYSQMGLLAIELGGNTQGLDYDWLSVTGAAILGGQLELALLDGFTPNAGDTFQVLTAASITPNGLTLAGELASTWDYRIVAWAGGEALEVYALSAVPEPSALALTLISLAASGLLGYRQRNRHASPRRSPH